MIPYMRDIRDQQTLLGLGGALTKGPKMRQRGAGAAAADGWMDL